MAPCSFLYGALAALLCLTAVFAEQVHYLPCPASEEGGPGSSNCVVNAVRVNPCNEAAESKPCKIKKGRVAAIGFDFTPGAAVSAAETRAYWAHSEGDLPFVGMNTNGCEGTTCPMEAGTQYTYNYNLEISKKFPVRSYDVKWKLWNESQDVLCCFIFKIKLVK